MRRRPRRSRGRPWRDHLVDLRVDDHADAVAELERLVALSDRYHRMVEYLERAMDGEVAEALEGLDDTPVPDPAADPDMAMWRAMVLAIGGRDAEAHDAFVKLDDVAPAFAEAARRLVASGLVSADVLDGVLPGDHSRSSSCSER